MAVCFVGIGSNLGNRKKNIVSSIKEISILENTKILKKSRVIETMPCGGPPGQNNFLNMAVKINTEIPPYSLLKKFKKIEQKLGRVETVRNGPRIIDLDILLYGNKIVNTKKLTIPHARMFERDFVLGPLAEII